MTPPKKRRKLPKGGKLIGDISVQAQALDRYMDDYGIETGDYFNLARRLAIDYVPGFPRFKLEHGDYGKVMRDKGGAKPTGRAKSSTN
jgi:hypothetical protein